MTDSNFQHSCMQVGDWVQVKSIPQWLIHDLPHEEQVLLRQHLGAIVRIVQLQPHGYLWLALADGTEGLSLHFSEVQRVANCE